MGCSRRLVAAITALVNFSQPKALWLPALWASTVRTLFSRNTPCLAQPVRSPWLGGEMPKSEDSSL